MHRGKRDSLWLVGLSVGIPIVSVIALLKLIPLSKLENATVVVFTVVFFVCFTLIALFVISWKLRGQTRAYGMQQEIDRQLRLIDRNRRGSQAQRKALVKDTFALVAELNQYMTVTTYVRTKRALLAARQEFSEIKTHPVLLKARASKKRKPSLEKRLQLEADLTELTLAKLDEMILVPDHAKGTDALGKEQLSRLLKEHNAYFDQEYQSLSPYFGAITTFVCYLNAELSQGNVTLSQYDNQLAVLRNHLTRNDLLVLFLYALLCPSGCQLAVAFVGSSFFGDFDQVAQNQFVEVPEIFRGYLELFTKDTNRRRNEHQQRLIRYFYQARQHDLAKSYRNRKTAINRVLSGEYYVTNETGQVFVTVVDKLNLG